MRIVGLLLVLAGTVSATPEVWFNQSQDRNLFYETVQTYDGQSISEYELNRFAQQAADSSFLLDKIEAWEKGAPSPTIVHGEFRELQKSYLFSADNRLILFEFFKAKPNLDAVSFKTLCHLYANDPYLKNAEPFFTSSCALKRVPLNETNPALTQFDFMLVDGNKIDIRQSPQFYTVGLEHKFVFISDRFVTKEVQATSATLKNADVKLEPWIDGTCDKVTSDKIAVSDPVKIYFSKECTRDYQGQLLESPSFLSRNKYYILSGILVALVGAYLGSQYELGVSLSAP